MDWTRIPALLLLFSAPCWAQDDAGEGADDDESVIEIGDAGGGGGDYDGVRIEPYPPSVPVEQEEPNRPEPVVVGEWQPPTLKPAQQELLDDLLARRAAEPQSAAPRYRLAEFYLQNKWLPHAEAEFLAAAKLDPKSIRPWEGLLRVYAAEVSDAEDPNELVFFPAGMPPAQQRQLRRELGLRRNQPDWIASPRERAARIARALTELVRLRPDDITRRRQLLDHYRAQGRYDQVVEQARAILERAPGDVATRCDLVQALLFRAGDGETPAEVRTLLEENVKRAPDHVPSLIRLARVLAVQDGAKARDRITELQQRAFLRLFLIPEMGPVPYREDTFRMAKDLGGKVLANDLWDSVMVPPGGGRGNDDGARHVVRWLEPFKFPHRDFGQRERVVRTLARRGDAAAAVVILSYLWHAEDPERIPAENAPQRRQLERTVQAALESVGGLGEVAFPAAERFLGMATTPMQRRRGVAALRLIGDKRGTGALIDALAWETMSERPYGVAAALEALGDPRAVAPLAAAARNERLPMARRREAAEALAAFQDSRAVETIDLLRQQEGFETVAAYARFRLTGDEAALAQLVKFVEQDGGSLELLRLAEKCPDARIKRVHLAILRKSRDPELREATLRRIRARFWEESRAEVEAIFLKEAESHAVSDFVLHELGEIGGETATTHLLAMLESDRLADLQWAAACRALARTGDERAVRWFSRRKVLEKDPGKRRLAAQLHAEAAKRHAELLRKQ